MTFMKLDCCVVYLIGVGHKNSHIHANCCFLSEKRASHMLPLHYIFNLLHVPKNGNVRVRQRNSWWKANKFSRKHK